MTIAITVKVDDGIVLASDSAATITLREPDGSISVGYVYNNANKILNLVKGLPIGYIHWGQGSIGSASISTLVKDLRERFAKSDPSSEWFIDRHNYSVEAVAHKVKKYLYDELYVPLYSDWVQKPSFGFVVAGYSTGCLLAEQYLVMIDEKGNCIGPSPLVKLEDTGTVNWFGQPEAASRLILGFSPQLPTLLEGMLGLNQEQSKLLTDYLRQNLTTQAIVSSMPIQDAIDFAEFIADLSIKYSRFTPGAATIGGPVEVAAITKHEGFKWIKRKHYYDRMLNQDSYELRSR